MMAFFNGRVAPVYFARFDQNEIIRCLSPSKPQHDKLCQYVKEHGGLCEIICNHIIIEGLFDGKDVFDYSKYFWKLHVESIADNPINKHLMDVFSGLIQRIKAFFFGIYPNNVLSDENQKNLVQNVSSFFQIDKYVVNQEILEDALDEVGTGEMIKLQVVRRSFFTGFSGHSCLVKKTSEGQYLFFNPNEGLHWGLSLEQLSSLINEHLKGGGPVFDGDDIWLVRESDYLEKLEQL